MQVFVITVYSGSSGITSNLAARQDCDGRGLGKLSCVREESPFCGQELKARAWAGGHGVQVPLT